MLHQHVLQCVIYTSLKLTQHVKFLYFLLINTIYC